MDWTDFTTRFVIPPLLGAFGGLTTAWALWGAEKRRMRVQRKQQLIHAWRTELLPALRDEISRTEFLNHPTYSSLRPHLSAEFIKRLETGSSTVNIGGGPLRLLFIDEIARIEREWKLI
jgi:hypothetical protein